MQAPEICIDFGSSRTKVAYLPAPGASPTLIELGTTVRAVIPSVFLIPANEEGDILVGDDALRLADQDPDGLVTDIKRDIHRPDKLRRGPGRPPLTRAELVTALFAYIRRRCTEEVFHRQELTSCVLTVPVRFNERQRECLVESAHSAGFSEVRTLEEPVAAARHWLLSPTGQGLGRYVIVVDIGGGTTDIGSLAWNGEAFVPIADLAHGGFLVGGNDIDARLVQSLNPPGNQWSWMVKVQGLKEMLPKSQRASYRVNLGTETLEVRRDMVEELSRGLVRQTVEEVGRYLSRFEALTGDRTCPLLLAGGGSKLLGMREALEPLAPGRILAWYDSDFAIVKGGICEARPTSPSAQPTSSAFESGHESPTPVPPHAVPPAVEPVPTRHPTPPAPGSSPNTSPAARHPLASRLTRWASILTIGLILGGLLWATGVLSNSRPGDQGGSSQDGLNETTGRPSQFAAQGEQQGGSTSARDSGNQTNTADIYRRGVADSLAPFQLTDSAQQAEVDRKAGEARKAEEARRAEAVRKAEEARRAEEARKAEEARRAEEARKAEAAHKAELTSRIQRVEQDIEVYQKLVAFWSQQMEYATPAALGSGNMSALNQASQEMQDALTHLLASQLELIDLQSQSP